MEILGVGGAELVVILLVALVVAGPQRMIRWSYVLGTYAAKLRTAWSAAATALQREFDEAGVDIRVPKDIPTRQNISQEINRAVAPYVKQIREPIDEVSKEIKAARTLAQMPPESAPPTIQPAPLSEEPVKLRPDFGTWSASAKPTETEPEHGGDA